MATMEIGVERGKPPFEENGANSEAFPDLETSC
jgi:hypothetical protein